MAVEVVAVGDRGLDERHGCAGSAAREAILNAAKFAGAGRIDVYAEASEERVEVFVRDRGAGFDPDAVPADRRGVRESIVGRMERHGGHAEVRSRPGGGTEVELTPDAVRRALIRRRDRRRPRALPRGRAQPSSRGCVEIVGEAGTVEEAVALIATAKPDVVLLDVHMPGGGGVAVIRRWRMPADARFLALSVSDAPEDVIAVIRAGARGYVTKTISADELADAIRGCARATRSSRRGWRASCWTRSAASARGQVDPELDQLTPREREVLRLIARGYLYKEIALRASASRAKTVEAHVSAVLRKLQLSSRHELSRWAVERAWTEGARFAGGALTWWRAARVACGGVGVGCCH